MNDITVPIHESRHHIAAASGVALLVAGLLVVTVVLPAEFAVDPLGTGAKLGLRDLGAVGRQVDALNKAGGASASQTAIIASQPKPFHHETVEFTLQPKESLEYKYRLDKGQSLLYAWKSTAPIDYEFHAEPDGAPRGYAQSYEKSAGAQQNGTLSAPFNGIHGWYWENTTTQPVTVSLSSAGFYNLAHEFHAGQPVKNKTFP
jgi:hypothetical protein